MGPVRQTPIQRTVRSVHVCVCVVSPCQTSPCMNAGTCTLVNNTRTCDCQLGYMGDNCQWREYSYTTSSNITLGSVDMLMYD